MVGTRKGLWIGTLGRGPHATGTWTGPHFPMEEVYSCMVDTRGEHARGCSPAPRSSWLGPQVWRSDDLGATWQETPNGAVRFPEDTDATRGPGLAAEPGPAAEDGVVYAGTEPGAVFRSTDRGETFALERGLWDHPHRPEWNAGFGGQAFHTILPHPDRPAARCSRRSRPAASTAPTTAATSWTPSNTGHQGRVPARGAQLPRVRPVRAQGRPATPPTPSGSTCRTTAASTAPTTAAPPGRTSRPGCRRVRLPDGGPPARRRHGLHLPDRRRRAPAGRSTARPGSGAPTDAGATWEPLGEGTCPTASTSR